MSVFRSPRFSSTLSRTLLVPTLVQGSLFIEGDEAVHAIRVLRVRVGDSIRLANGDGFAASAQVTAVKHDLLGVSVGPLEILQIDKAMQLSVAVAPPKGDRWTDLVRSLTELGVGSIVPLITQRGERMPSNLDRARKVAAEAVKQCRRSHIPEITQPTDISKLSRSSRWILLDPQGCSPHPGAPSPTTLIIGPEGGFTESEVSTIKDGGAEGVRIAGPILRIETAAVAAAAVWAAAWEGH